MHFLQFLSKFIQIYPNFFLTFLLSHDCTRLIFRVFFPKILAKNIFDLFGQTSETALLTFKISLISQIIKKKIRKKRTKMKLFLLFFGISQSWFLDEKLPKSKNFYEILQIRVDQMFRDAISEHRENVAGRVKKMNIFYLKFLWKFLEIFHRKFLKNFFAQNCLKIFFVENFLKIFFVENFLKILLINNIWIFQIFLHNLIFFRKSQDFDFLLKISWNFIVENFLNFFLLKISSDI